MKFSFTILFLTLFTLLNAQTTLGTIDMFKGTLKIKSANSIKKHKIKKGMKIFTGDMLLSSKNASARINLVDGSTLILDESSTLIFHSLLQTEQQKGKVLYKITSRDARHSLKVKTPFAIIGIKGTTFIVNASKTSSISLKEGKIGIKSIHKEFKLYRKKLDAEFNAFKEEGKNHIQKEKEAFEKYKKSQTSHYEKVKIVKEFDLKSGMKVSFSKNKVKEDSFSKDDTAEFKHFDNLLNLMQ